MKNPSSFLKVRIYPSLDFTLGANVPPKKDTTQSSTEIQEDSYKLGYRDYKFYEVSNNDRIEKRELDKKALGNLGEEKIYQLLEAQERRYQECIENNDLDGSKAAIAQIEKLIVAPSLLGLSVATNSHKAPRKQRGLGGITPYGKRFVRSGLAVLEDKYSRECLTLGTATLPALSSEEFEKVCSNWSELVRQFFQELGRELVRKNLAADYVQVTEIQERRFNQSGDVGLHLHWVMPGKRVRGDNWAFTPTEIRGIWQRLLTNIIGREVDCTAATRIEKPKKSLAAELGKYLSKGVTAIQAVVQAGKSHLLPSSWWGSNKSLKTEVRSQIVEISGAVAIWIDRNLREMKAENRIWYVDIWVENSGQEFRAGAVGRFNSRAECDELLELREIFESCDEMTDLALNS